MSDELGEIGVTFTKWTDEPQSRALIEVNAAGALGTATLTMRYGVDSGVTICLTADQAIQLGGELLRLGNWLADPQTLVEHEERMARLLNRSARRSQS